MWTYDIIFIDLSRDCEMLWRKRGEW